MKIKVNQPSNKFKVLPDMKPGDIFLYYGEPYMFLGLNNYQFKVERNNQYVPFIAVNLKTKNLSGWFDGPAKFEILNCSIEVEDED